ncbi:hypothetical protein ACFSNO_11535 [Streptomyces cirratus]
MTIGSSTVSSQAACRPAKGEDLSIEKVQACLANVRTPRPSSTAAATRCAWRRARRGRGRQEVAGGPRRTADHRALREHLPQLRGRRRLPTGGQGEAPASKMLGFVQVGPDGKPLAVWTYKVKLK